MSKYLKKLKCIFCVLHVINKYSANAPQYFIEIKTNIAMKSVLPSDIINTILLFDGHIKYRNRKYYNQISPFDIRRQLLMKIPKKRTVPSSSSSQVELNIGKGKSYILTVAMQEDFGPFGFGHCIPVHFAQVFIYENHTFYMADSKKTLL